MKWYIGVIKRYASCKGRARRKEFWLFVLVNYLITAACGMADNFLGLQTVLAGQTVAIITMVYTLLVLIPCLAVSIRRLHDIDKSGWWLLLALAPVVGWAWLLVYSLLEGTPCCNRYGDNPRLADTIKIQRA